MKIVLIIAAITAALFIAMVTFTLPLRPSIPQLQLTFTETAFKTIIDAWQPIGVERFKAHFAIDFPFLLCYGTLGYLIATRTKIFSHWPVGIQFLLAYCLPFAAGADVIENFLHLHLVSNAGHFPEPLYILAGTSASFKWLLDGIFVCSVVCAGFKRKDRA